MRDEQKRNPLERETPSSFQINLHFPLLRIAEAVNNAEIVGKLRWSNELLRKNLLVTQAMAIDESLTQIEICADDFC